jgi:flagellar biosynthesis/type III secretory pathway M-ring protein FliF/YscJ
VSPETVAALEQNVKTFVGADATATPSRQVSVQQVEFDKTAIEAEKKAMDASATSDRTNRMLGYGVPLLLMLIMLIILAKGLKKLVPVAGPQLALQGASAGKSLGLSPAPLKTAGLDLTIGDNDSKLAVVRDGEALENTILGLAQGEQVHTFEVINQNFDADLASVKHLASTKPDTVAALLKSWVAEKQR